MGGVGGLRSPTCFFGFVFSKNRLLPFRNIAMSVELRRKAVEIYSRGLARITPEFLLRQALALGDGTLELNFLEGRASVPLEPGGRIFLLANQS